MQIYEVSIQVKVKASKLEAFQSKMAKLCQITEHQQITITGPTSTGDKSSPRKPVKRKSPLRSRCKTGDSSPVIDTGEIIAGIAE